MGRKGKARGRGPRLDCVADTGGEKMTKDQNMEMRLSGMAPGFYWTGSRRGEGAVGCLREEWRTHFGTIQKWWAAIRGERERQD